jgi:hypothetical protein
MTNDMISVKNNEMMMNNEMIVVKNQELSALRRRPALDRFVLQKIRAVTDLSSYRRCRLPSEWR